MGEPAVNVARTTLFNGTPSVAATGRRLMMGRPTWFSIVAVPTDVSGFRTPPAGALRTTENVLLMSYSALPTTCTLIGKLVSPGRNVRVLLVET